MGGGGWGGGRREEGRKGGREGEVGEGEGERRGGREGEGVKRMQHSLMEYCTVREVSGEGGERDKGLLPHRQGRIHTALMDSQHILQITQCIIMNVMTSSNSYLLVDVAHVQSDNGLQCQESTLTDAHLTVSGPPPHHGNYQTLHNLCPEIVC